MPEHASNTGLATTVMNWPSIDDAKRERLALKGVRLAELIASLKDYAKRHGGCFVVFGSSARGDFREDSDVDILVRFPETLQSDAWRFAEDACWQRGLSPDVRPTSMCSERFLDKVMQRAHLELR